MLNDSSSRAASSGVLFSRRVKVAQGLTEADQGSHVVHGEVIHRAKPFVLNLRHLVQAEPDEALARRVVVLPHAGHEVAKLHGIVRPASHPRPLLLFLEHAKHKQFSIMIDRPCLPRAGGDQSVSFTLAHGPSRQRERMKWWVSVEFVGLEFGLFGFEE